MCCDPWCLRAAATGRRCWLALSAGPEQATRQRQRARRLLHRFVCGGWRGGNWSVSPDGRQGTRELIALAGIVVTITLAFIAYVQVRPEPNTPTTLVYLGLTGLPWLAMWAIYCVRKFPDRKTLAFDRSTVMLARCLIWLTFLGVVGTALAFGESLLPGQIRDVTLPVSEAESFPWPETHEDIDIAEGEIGVRAYLYFFPPAHSFRELPETLTFDAALDRTVASSWHIVSARGYRIDPHGRQRHDPTSARPPAPMKRFSWRGLLLDRVYLLELRLKQVGPTVAKERLIERIMEDRKGVLTVKVYYLQRHVQ